MELASAVRGMILLGVLSWYSAIVWRMMDGYFKDQFRAYLQDEYRRHPRMQADVESARDVDKVPVPDALPAEPSPRGVEEICALDATSTRTTTTAATTTTTLASSCAVDITDVCPQWRLPSRAGRKPGGQVTGGTGENAVATAAVGADKNAFPENAARSTLESRKPMSSSSGACTAKDGDPGTINQDVDREQETTEEKSEVVLASSAASTLRRKEGSLRAECHGNYRGNEE